MISSEAIVVWADGTWCYGAELSEMDHMSDDFKVYEPEHPDYDAKLAELTA